MNRDLKTLTLKSLKVSNFYQSSPVKPPLTAYPFILLVRLYQLTLSPIFGHYCRFEPTCSNYAIDALTKYGAWKGSLMAVKRIGRCHPWHPGGYDPVN